MMILTLAATQIRGTTYGVGRVEVNYGPVIAVEIKVKAGAATYVGGEADAVFWLTLRGLKREEAAEFVKEGLRQFDERDRLEREARAASRNN